MGTETGVDVLAPAGRCGSSAAHPGTGAGTAVGDDCATIGAGAQVLAGGGVGWRILLWERELRFGWGGGAQVVASVFGTWFPPRRVCDSVIEEEREFGIAENSWGMVAGRRQVQCFCSGSKRLVMWRVLLARKMVPQFGDGVEIELDERQKRWLNEHGNPLCK